MRDKEIDREEHVANGHRSINASRDVTSSILNTGDHNTFNLHVSDPNIHEEIIERFDHQSKAISGPPRKLVKSRLPTNPYFSGRIRELEDLKQLMNPGSGLPAVLAIHGEGGIGKSSVAIQFAHDNAEAYDVLLYCVADSIANLSTGFRQIADQLALPEANDANDNKVVRAVHDWLNDSSNARYLLILDSADPNIALPVDDFKMFLPESPRGHILLTTRLENVLSTIGWRGQSKFRLPPFEIKEAAKFLLQRTDRDENDSEEYAAALHLADDLGGLPLALEQAAVYVEMQGQSFIVYHAQYKKRNMKLLNQSRPKMGDYPNTVATTWQINFDAVQKQAPASAELLSLCAFLPPYQIPAELVLEAAKGSFPRLTAHFYGAKSPADIEAKWDTLLAPLTQYSLITKHPGHFTFGIHRLIQSILQDKLVADDWWTKLRSLLPAAIRGPFLTRSRKEWLGKILDIIVGCFPNPNFENWQRCERIVAAAQAVLDAIVIDKLTIPKTEFLMNQVASYLMYKGRYREAEALFVEALSMNRATLPAGHIDLSVNLNNLTWLYKLQGRYNDAEPLCLESLAIREEALPEGHPDIARSLDNLGSLYFAQGRYDEAEPLCLRSVAINRDTLPEGHPGIALSLGNLANLYNFQGRSDKAEILYLEALAIRRTTLQDTHPDVATSLNDLAGLYSSQGRYVEAEPLYLEALAVRRKIHVDVHPEIASSLNNLAALYKSQGRYSEAELLHVEALRQRRILLPPGHQNIGVSLDNLAGIYELQGRYVEAEPLCVEALAIMRAALPQDHPEIAVSLINLAGLYQAIGRYDEVEKLLIEALVIERQALPPGHSDIVTGLNNLASLYIFQGRYDEAEPLCKEALAIRRTALPHDHPKIATSLSILARLYKSQGRIDDAEVLFVEALALKRMGLPTHHSEIATALNNLAWLYDSQGRYNDAEPLYVEALAIKRVALPTDHPDIALSLSNLGNLYRSQGRHVDAEPLLVESLKINRGALSVGHAHIAISLSTLAILYSSQGRFDEAEPLYVEALSIGQEKLGVAHPTTLTFAENYRRFLDQKNSRAASNGDH